MISRNLILGDRCFACVHWNEDLRRKDMELVYHSLNHRSLKKEAKAREKQATHFQHSALSHTDAMAAPSRLATKRKRAEPCLSHAIEKDGFLFSRPSTKQQKLA